MVTAAFFRRAHPFDLPPFKGDSTLCTAIPTRAGRPDPVPGPPCQAWMPAKPSPRPQPGHRPPRHTGRHGATQRRPRRGPRVLGGPLAPGGIALSLMIFQYQFRYLEADVAGHIYGLVTPVLAASTAPIIWFGLGTSRAYGLEITPDCSSALLIVPLCGLGMLLMIPRPGPPVGRVAKALSGCQPSCSSRETCCALG